MNSLMTSRIRGFSVVELMVSMTIGLIILAAVSSILVNSNKNYNTTDSMSRLQENARFAMQFIGLDLRRAGYFGCADDVENVKSTVNGGSLGGVGTIAVSAVEGSNNMTTGSIWSPSGQSVSASLTGMIAGTDAVAIRYLDLDNPITIEKAMPNESAVLFVNTGHKLVTGDIIAITDCDSVDVMQLTNVQDAGGGVKDNLVHNAGTGTPGNSTQKLSKSYATGAVVFKLNSFAYYIGAGASGQPALLRTSSGGSQELVEGVENMQVTYGEVTTSDRIPTTYRQAADVTNWRNVISVRVGLLVGTVANTADGQLGTETLDTGTYNVNGTVIDPPDQRRIRKVFVSTFMLRNVK